MDSFYAAFPDLRKSEMRTILFGEPGSTGMPDVHQAPQMCLDEFYCVDPTCDCQRVILKVFEILDPQNPDFQEVATINFSWGDGVLNSLVAQLGNPFLDPINFQRGDAEEVMKMINATCLSESRYVDRLARHYHQLRVHSGSTTRRRGKSLESTRMDFGAGLPIPTSASRKKRRKLLDRRINQSGRA